MEGFMSTEGICLLSLEFIHLFIFPIELIFYYSNDNIILIITRGKQYRY